MFSASMVSRRNPPLLECMLPYIVRSNLEVNYLCRLESTLLHVVMLFEELNSLQYFTSSSVKLNFLITMGFF